MCRGKLITGGKWLCHLTPVRSTGGKAVGGNSLATPENRDGKCCGGLDRKNYEFAESIV